MNETFEEELKELINRHSKEKASNAPDFILAQYMRDCLLVFETAVQQRRPSMNEVLDRLKQVLKMLERFGASKVLRTELKRK